MPPFPQQVAVNMELLYHVREDDSLVGPIEREKAHAEGLLHRAGMVFLLRSDGKLLLQYRSPSRETFPDCYDSSCSFHVAYGESYEEAARREMVEETGISAPVAYIGKFTHFDPPENEIVEVFLCHSDGAVEINLDESSAVEFCTKEEVDEIVRSKNPSPWLRDAWVLLRDKL